MANYFSIRHDDRNLWVSLLKGILLIVFGVWLFKSPIESLNKLNFLFGLIIFLGGALEFFFFFKKQKNNRGKASFLAGGFLDVILGLFLMANPKFILIVITLLVSLWLIFRGVLSIRNALTMREQSMKNWGWTLTLGIVLILLAVLLIWHPKIVGITIVFWTAIAFISFGILRILLVFKMHDSDKKNHISDAEIVE